MFKWLFCESDYVWKELGLCKAFMLNESLRFWMGYNFGRIATGSAADVEVSNSNQPREVSWHTNFFFQGKLHFRNIVKAQTYVPLLGVQFLKYGLYHMT